MNAKPTHEDPAFHSYNSRVAVDKLNQRWEQRKRDLDKKIYQAKVKQSHLRDEMANIRSEPMFPRIESIRNRFNNWVASWYR